jgi:ATP-binding cassette, subfamily B, bacterial PglK
MLQLSLFSKLNSLKPLWDALSPKRRRQLLALQLLSLVAAFGEVANLGALMPFLKLLANPQESLKGLGPLGDSLRSLPPQNLLLALGLGFVLVVIASSLLRVLTIQVQLKLSALIGSDLGEQVFEAVLDRPYEWHLKHNSSTTLGYLTKDTDQVFSSVQALLTVVVNLAIVILLAGSLIVLAPEMMLAISIFFAGFYLLTYRFTRGQLRIDGQELTKNYQKSLQVAQEGLGGIRDVLLDETQDFFLFGYQKFNRIYRLASAAINIKAQIPRYLIEGFSVILIIGISVYLAMSGQGIDKQLPLLGTLALGAYRLLQPLQQCFNGISSLQANQASLDKIAPYLGSKNHSNQKISRLDAINPLAKSSDSPLVELQKISFRYDLEAPDVLHNISLSISQGERIALVGTTGSGKSTCSDLILGLLVPTQGTISIYGHDLHSSQELINSWKAKVAHVPQQIYLTDASFAENIAFGIPLSSIDHERVRRSALQARISEVIESSPEGYSTLVGERGVRLSGGQRQRIGIARALYKQATLLVLDEATSALDSQTEAEVMQAIESLDRNLTIIIIAHRLSTVRNCDRIVVMDRGEISAIGTYNELEKSHLGFQRLSFQPPYPINP